MSRDTTCEKPVESLCPAFEVCTLKSHVIKNLVFIFIIISILTFMKLAK